MFSTQATASRVIKYSDIWDQDNIVQSEYKQNPNVLEDESFGNAPAPALRLKVEEFVKRNGNLRQQDFVAQIWALVFGSQTTTSTAAPAGTTKSLAAPSTTTDPSTATLSGRTRRTTKFKIKGYCKNPPKTILPENDSTSTTTAPLG